MADIVVATNGNYFANVILEELFASDVHRVQGVVVVNGDYGGYGGLRALWRLARRTTLPYLLFKLFNYALFKVMRTVWPGDWEVGDTAQRRNIPCLVSPSINTDTVANFVRSCHAELLVSVSCPQRIRKPLLDAAKAGAINIHSSLLPRYAGLAPYFWVLSRGESVTGITIHYMTERFDAGRVLVQEQCAIPRQISAFGLFYRQACLGRQWLPEAIRLAAQGNPGRPQKLTEYSYYSHPDWSSYCSLYRNGHRLIRLADIVAIIREHRRDPRAVPAHPAVPITTTTNQDRDRMRRAA